MVAYDYRIGGRRNISTLDTDMTEQAVFELPLGEIETELLARELLERRSRKAQSRKAAAAANKPPPRRGRGLIIGLFVLAFTLGTALFAAAFATLGGAALLGALLFTIPMVDVVTTDAPTFETPTKPAKPGPKGNEAGSSLPGQGGSDAELVIMPDPGFKGK